MSGSQNDFGKNNDNNDKNVMHIYFFFHLVIWHHVNPPVTQNEALCFILNVANFAFSLV